MERVQAVRGGNAGVKAVWSAFVLLRPKQWTKNLLVFAAALFTGTFTLEALRLSGLAFAAMCLASSATYVFNDLRDAQRDRNHPKKKLRPIASGDIAPVPAGVIGLLALAGSFALAWSLGHGVVLAIAGYLGLQAAYNLGLKAVPITDVFIIALGFVVRAVLGALAMNVMISGWLFFCTMFLALMLGFSKRRDEFLRMGEFGSGSRSSLQHYSQPVLDLMVGLFAGASMLSYGIYSIESQTAKAHPSLILTALFVTYGICRYLYLVFHDSQGEEPETILLTDRHIIISVAGFVVAAGLAVTDTFERLVR